VQAPQLLLISSHAAKDTSSAATFSVIVTIGGKRAIALVDCGSTDIFVDYSLASKVHYQMQSLPAQQVAVAGGGHLESSTMIPSATYSIPQEVFTSGFKLLPLRGYDIILGCDWIKLHSPIQLDLRDDFRHLSIHKDGITRVTFSDLTAPKANLVLTAAKLDKLYRSEILGYVTQINLLRTTPPEQNQPSSNKQIAIVLDQFEDVFAAIATLPPKRACDHAIPLQPGPKPPNIRPYRIPHKQKEEVQKLIQDMVIDDIIRANTSLYSSLVWLMKAVYLLH
jgi:hypothetical protein